MNVTYSLDIHKMNEFRFSMVPHSIRGFVQAYTFVKYRLGAEGRGCEIVTSHFSRTERALNTCLTVLS
jgi:hypothetical protein